MTIAYICNCERPCNKSIDCIKNGGECSHTLDVRYAKNYSETPLVTGNKNFVNLSKNGEAHYIEEENNG